LCKGEQLEKFHVCFKAPPMALEQLQALDVDENNLKDVHIILN
jgi:hypothetical protein